MVGSGGFSWGVGSEECGSGRCVLDCSSENLLGCLGLKAGV